MGCHPHLFHGQWMHLQQIVVIDHVLTPVMIMDHLRVLKGVYLPDSIHHDMLFFLHPTLTLSHTLT